jgi:hypothetical protein
MNETPNVQKLEKRIAEQKEFVKNTLKIGVILAVVLPIIFGGVGSFFVFYGESLGIAFAAAIIASEMATAAALALFILVPFMLVVVVTLVLVFFVLFGGEYSENLKKLETAQLLKRSEEGWNSEDWIPKEVKQTLDEYFFGKGGVNKIKFYNKPMDPRKGFLKSCPIFKGIWKKSQNVPFIAIRVRCISKKEEIKKVSKYEKYCFRKVEEENGEKVLYCLPEDFSEDNKGVEKIIFSEFTTGQNFILFPNMEHGIFTWHQSYFSALHPYFFSNNFTHPDDGKLTESGNKGMSLLKKLIETGRSEDLNGISWEVIYD